MLLLAPGPLHMLFPLPSVSLYPSTPQTAFEQQLGTRHREQDTVPAREPGLSLFLSFCAQGTPIHSSQFNSTASDTLHLCLFHREELTPMSAAPLYCCPLHRLKFSASQKSRCQDAGRTECSTRSCLFQSHWIAFGSNFIWGPVFLPLHVLHAHGCTYVHMYMLSVLIRTY